LAHRALIRRSTRLGSRFAGVWAIVLALAVATTAPSVSPAVAAPAPDAAGSQARVDAARRESEALASRYFAQLDRFQVVGSEIEATEKRMADIREQAGALRAVVARRALRAYKNGDSVDFVLDGTDIFEVARGAKLLSAANQRDDDAVAELANLTDDLQGRRAELERSRDEESAALEALKAAQRRVDANLRAAVADQESVAARLEAQAAAERAAKQAAASNGSSSSTTAGSASGTGNSTAVTPLAPPIDYTPNNGSHPHHDDPFLSCTRARESGGNYSVVNPSGPYLGAYQFLQSTWNVSAQHAGRAELVGVPPNVASVYDQDDMAWTLYQWQGTGPWGGAC
jgi:peptidoglycan hydrolase CwlO-like protein